MISPVSWDQMRPPLAREYLRRNIAETAPSCLIFLTRNI